MESKYDDENDEEKIGGVEDATRRVGRARRNCDFKDCENDAKDGNCEKDDCATTDAEVS